MNKIFKKIAKSIKKFLKYKNKSVCFFNREEIDPAVLVPETSKIEQVKKRPYEYSVKIKPSGSLKRICKRIIENKRLFNILKHTNKNRTKKKLEKRINKNNKLNELDK